MNNQFSAIRKRLFFLIFIKLSFIGVEAQNFTNPDLEGSIFSFSSLPTGWDNVEATDPICLSDNLNLGDTPDLCNLTLPNNTTGVAGIAHSGNTFVSGLLQLNDGSGIIFHEGIQQTVTGLTIGQNYNITFHQAVVKQVFALDQSGSWSVYMDNDLLGVTAVTGSTLDFENPSLIWEQRSVSFAPTATSHTFKFLPTDDDPDITSSITNTLGSIRMGIDNININSDCLLELGSDFVLCEDDLPVEIGTDLVGTYIWSTGDTVNSIEVNESGVYVLEVNSACGVLSDSISVDVITPPSPVDLGEDFEVCPQDFPIEIQASSEGDYLWNTLEITQSIFVSLPGEYIVNVFNSCGFVIDSINIAQAAAAPIISLGEDINACVDDFPISLNAGLAESIIWNNGDTTQFLLTESPGEFSVVATNTCGTTMDDISIFLINPPEEITLGPDVFVCENEFPINVNLEVEDYNIEWSNGSVDQQIVVIEEGLYGVEASNQCGTSNADLLITSIPNEINDQNIILCQGQSEQFLGTSFFEEGNFEIIIPSSASNQCDIFWNVNVEVIPTDTIYEFLELAEGGTVSFQGYNFNETGIYYLVEEVEDGCNKIVNLLIEDSEEIFVYVPSAFTPGEDDLNNLFRPVVTLVGDVEMSQFEFEIYDRYGHIVFETEDYTTMGWNGSGAYNKNFFTQDEVYNWSIKYNSSGKANTEQIYGTVMILR